MYQSFARSLIEYAAPLFGELPNKVMDKLEKLQYDASLVVTGNPKSTSYNKALDEAGWRSMTDRFIQLRMSLGNPSH